MRRIVAAVLALALIAAAVVTFRVVNSEESDDASPESPVIQDAADIEIERTPESWQIVYRLEEHGGERVTVSTDKVWARRPFESRLETWSGPPPGRKRQSVQVGSFARRGTQAEGAERLVLQLPPGAPPSDVRVLPVLAVAEDEGLIDRREVREVAERRCQVFRSGSLLSAPAITKPSKENYADSCIDAVGLVLEETLVEEGEILSRRVAVEVIEDGDVEDVEFSMPEGEPVPVEKGGGRVQALTLDSRPPGEFYELPAPPSGFTHRGRFTVIPPQPDNFSDPLREGFIFGGVSDVYERDEDFVVIDQWGTLQGQEPPAPPPAYDKVSVPNLGEGSLSISGAGSELRFELSGGRFVRLSGPVEPDELTRIARELVVVPGGTLTPLPPG